MVEEIEDWKSLKKCIEVTMTEEGLDESHQFNFHDPHHDPSVFIPLYLCKEKIKEDKHRISIAKWNMPKADFMHYASFVETGDR